MEKELFESLMSGLEDAVAFADAVSSSVRARCLSTRPKTWPAPGSR